MCHLSRNPRCKTKQDTNSDNDRPLVEQTRWIASYIITSIPYKAPVNDISCLPLATTFSTGTCESQAMKPMTENITNPEKILVSAHIVHIKTTSLKVYINDHIIYQT